MNNEELRCYIVDSDMNIYTLKQKKIQQLLDNKDIAPLDIISQVDNDDLTSLLWEIICNFKHDNIYDLDCIINNLLDIKTDMENTQINELPF